MSQNQNTNNGNEHEGEVRKNRLFMKSENRSKTMEFFIGRNREEMPDRKQEARNALLRIADKVRATVSDDPTRDDYDTLFRRLAQTARLLGDRGTARAVVETALDFRIEEERASLQKKERHGGYDGLPGRVESQIAVLRSLAELVREPPVWMREGEDAWESYRQAAQRLYISLLTNRNPALRSRAVDIGSELIAKGIDLLDEALAMKLFAECQPEEYERLMSEAEEEESEEDAPANAAEANAS